MNLQSIILGSATLSVVLLGVALVFLVAFAPIWIYLSISMSWNLWGTASLFIFQTLHMFFLWRSVYYFALLRLCVLPIRALVVPLVFTVAKLEGIREGTPTFYLPISSHHDTSEDNSTPLLRQDSNQETESISRKRERATKRQYQKLEKIFRQDQIRHESHRSDWTMRLCDLVPIVWEHQKRVCQAEKTDPKEEFVKRFLVVTVLPHGILNYYYDPQGLCAFSLTIQQSTVLHPMMYFSRDSATKSGLWFHSIGTAIQRASHIPGVQFVNAGVHQMQTKRNAGFLSVEHTDSELQRKLYPFSLSTSPPFHILDVFLWQSVTESRSPENQEHQEAEQMSLPQT